MNSSLSALVGLTVTWLVITVTGIAIFDPANGFSPITLTFLAVLGVFTVFEAVRYSRAFKKEKAKAEDRRGHGF